MKSKRVVSLVLAFMMLVSMIPVSSLAAISPSASDDIANIKLMISDSFGSDDPIKSVPPFVPDDMPLTTPEEYKAVGEKLAMLSYSDSFSGKQPAEVVAKLDSVFTPDEDNTLDAIKPGDIIYVGVKAVLEQPSGTYKGIVKYTARLVYDPTKLELLDPTADTATNKTQFQNTVVTNLLGKNELNKSLSGDDSIKYSANFILDTGSAVGASTDTPSNKIMTIISGSVTTKYMPSGSTWDYIIPMKVKEGASGSTTISSVRIDGANSAEVVVGKNENGTDVTANGTTANFNDSTNGEHLKSNDVTINIAGPAITAAPTIVGTAAGQQITVTASNAKFDTTGAAAEANWELTGATSDGSTAQPTEVTVDPTGETATLTLPALSDTNASGVLTIKATSAALEGGTPADGLTTTINVKAAPQATFDYSTLSVKTTESTDVKFKVKGDDEWSSAFSSSTSAGVKLTDTQLAALNKVVNDGATVADAITVAWEDAETITSNISITKGAAPTALAIDYTNEETTATVPNTVEFKVGDGLYEDATGAKIDFATETAFGETITYRTKATAAALASSEKTLAVPAKPTVSLTTGDANKIDGVTDVTFSVTGENVEKTDIMYLIDQSASTAAGLNTAYRNETTLPATTADYIHAYIPADTDHFASEVIHEQGKGNTYATAADVSVGMNATDFTITLAGGTWKDTADDTPGNFTISGGSGSYTVTAAEVQSDTKQIKLTVDTALQGGNYTVKIPASSAERVIYGGSKADVSVNADNTVNLIVSSDSYTFTPSDVTFEGVKGTPSFSDVTYTSGSPAVTVTVTGLKAYEKLEEGYTTTTEKGGTVTVTGDNTFTYENSNAPTGKVTDTFSINVVPNPYEVQASDLQLTGTTKVYDGETNVPAGAAVSFTSGKPGSDYDELIGADLTLTGTMAFASADAGEETVALSDLAVTGDNAVYFDFETNKSGYLKEYEMSGNGITKATATQIIADVYSSKDLGATVSDLATALMTQNITVKTATDEFAAYETLGDILTQVNLEAAIQAYLNATYPVAATPVEISDEIDYTQSAQTVSTVKAETGATITLAGLADDATITATSGSGDFEIAADGKSVTVKAGAGSLDGATFTVRNGDASTCTITFTTFTVDNVADTGVDAIPEDATMQILLDDTNMTNVDTDSKTYTNFAITGLNASDEATALVIEAKHEKQTSGGGGVVVGNLVSYEVGENGTIVEGSSSEYVNTGDKPAAVPTVETKAGYTFMGWSLDKETYVDPATVVINGNTTFYAMYQKGYINGYEDGLFYPARNVTRAEFTKMLVMATGLYNGGKTYAATDLKDDKGAWYTNYIACAVEAGIVDGYEDGNFYPDRTITRQEAAKMVFVAMGDVTEVTTTDKITDFDTVSNWAKTYVASLVEADLIAGYEDGTFQPKRLISRAETATMIDRIAGFDPTDEEKAEIASTIAPTFEDVTPDSWAFAYIMFGCGELDDSYYA